MACATGNPFRCLSRIASGPQKRVRLFLHAGSPLPTAPCRAPIAAVDSFASTCRAWLMSNVSARKRSKTPTSRSRTRRRWHNASVPSDMSELQQLLSDSPLSPVAADSALLARFLHRELPAQTLFLEEGESGGKFAVVAEGILRASRRLTNDRDLPVFFLKRGDYLGFLPLLDGGPFPLTVVANTPARVYVLERRLFQEFLREHHDVCELLLAHVAKRFRECLDQLGTLGKPGALPRVAAALAAELPHDAAKGTMIDWPMRQAKLAEALGIAPENLSRAVTKLERLGILRRQTGHRVRVDDPVRLRAAAERSLSELDDRQ